MPCPPIRGRLIIDFVLATEPPWLEDADDIGPPLGRIILIQLFLSITLIVAAISSLVDISFRHSIPASFGTQHVALLMVDWAPSLFVGTIMLKHRFSTVPLGAKFRLCQP